MKYKQVVPRFIDRIFLDKDWSVRFALSSTVARLIGSEAIKKLQDKYNEVQIQLTDSEKKYYLTVHYAESLSSMGREEAIPILTEMLNQAISHQRKQSNTLIVQILYGLGEIGNEEVIDVLLAK
ncbi:MAG: HEAT repeat domain-containing protein, partial [Candidatus Heimdallarchaeota archaeon]